MNYQMEKMAQEIAALKESATRLREVSGNIQAVNKNVDRILACVKMLEINISDIAAFYPSHTVE